MGHPVGVRLGFGAPGLRRLHVNSHGWQGRLGTARRGVYLVLLGALERLPVCRKPLKRWRGHDGGHGHI